MNDPDRNYVLDGDDNPVSDDEWEARAESACRRAVPLLMRLTVYLAAASEAAGDLLEIAGEAEECEEAGFDCPADCEDAATLAGDALNQAMADLAKLTRGALPDTPSDDEVAAEISAARRDVAARVADLALNAEAWANACRLWPVRLGR